MNQFLRAAGLKEIRVDENQRTVVQTLKTENDYPREKRGEDREKDQEAVLVGKPWGEPREGEGHDQNILYRNLKYEN